MIYYPNAKINIGLNIFNKLPNGYHEIQSYFYPIPLYDILEIVPKEDKSKTVFSSSGIPIEGDGNLCLDAYNLLSKDFNLPSVKIHLHKQIPIGAGLGGGSADASVTLKALNELFKLNIENTKLEEYAKKLGADCPFFIDNKPKFVEGIGEILQDCSLDLSDLYLVLINPDIHISTKVAYQNLKLTNKQDLLNKSIEDLKNNNSLFVNDFENSIFPIYPEIKKIKETLYSNGAFYASMSGSGSSVFGLFKEKPNFNLNLNETILSL